MLHVTEHQDDMFMYTYAFLMLYIHILYLYNFIFCCLLFFRVADNENCFISNVHHV